MARNYPIDASEMMSPPISRVKVTSTFYRDVVEGEEDIVTTHVIAILQNFKNRGLIGSTVRVAVPGVEDLTYQVEM